MQLWLGHNNIIIPYTKWTTSIQHFSTFQIVWLGKLKINKKKKKKKIRGGGDSAVNGFLIMDDVYLKLYILILPSYFLPVRHIETSLLICIISNIRSEKHFSNTCDYLFHKNWYQNQYLSSPISYQGNNHFIIIKHTWPIICCSMHYYFITFLGI